jgi:hypothetical protein
MVPGGGVTATTLLRWVRKGAIVSGYVLLVSGCATSHGTAQPVLKASEVVGTWSNHKGSVITFQANGNFRVVGMDMAPNLANCSNVSGIGYWDFLSAAGDSPPTSVMYASGNQIELSFDGQNDSCNANLASWEIDPPVGLCLDFDPDDPCSGTPWTKEH